MFKKVVAALAAGAMFFGTVSLASAEYEYSYDKSNELKVISKDHQAYLYLIYDANGNIKEVGYCQSPANVTTSYVKGSGLLLNWDAVPGAISYRVYENGVALPKTYTTTSALLSEVSPTSDASNDFYVTAVFGDGVSESGPSNKVPLLPPPVFANAGSVTEHTATLTWQPVAGATGYRVYADGVQMQTTSDTTIKLDQLTAGHTYTFEVGAYNDQMEGMLTKQVLTTIQVPVVTVSNVSSTDASVSWTATPNAIGYRLYLNGNQVSNDLTGTSFMYTGGFDTSVAQKFTVRAVYRSKVGDSSDPATILPAPTITDGSATATTATINWTPIQDATSYFVTMFPQNGAPVTKTVTGTSATFTNLVMNANHSFTVKPVLNNTVGFVGSSYNLTTSYVIPTNVNATFQRKKIIVSVTPMTIKENDTITVGGTTVYSEITQISWQVTKDPSDTIMYNVYKTDASGNILSTLATNVTNTYANISVPKATTMSVVIKAVSGGVPFDVGSQVFTFTTPSS